MRTSNNKPPSWPANVQYIPAPRYHSSVPLSMRSFLTKPPTNRSASKSQRQNDISNHHSGSSSGLVRIRTISQASHPAIGQFGLFASKNIASNSHIIDYMGEIHCDDRSESNYDLSLHRSQDGTSVGVDAQSMGNEARFINDYRGVKDKPNAVFVDRRTLSGELRMSVWSSGAPIKKGEEILVTYGKSWWRARQQSAGISRGMSYT